MKKLIALFLVFVMMLSMASLALAEDITVTVFQLKVEIDPMLQKYAAEYSARTPGVTVKVETLGGGGDYGGVLKSKKQGDQMPSIFQIEGLSGYELWKDDMADLSNAKFAADTSVAYYAPDGKVVGFPIAIEGYGLGYNAEILEKAGIDPATLNTRANIQAAFEKIDSMKEELGLDMVVASAASLSGGMWWVMGQHIWSVYFSGGLDYTDTSIIDMATKEGKVDEDRLAQFAEYATLLMKYTDPDVLSNGDYNAQITAFANQKAAFITQGNWIDPNMKELGATFKMGYAPHAFLDTEDNGIQISPPSWWCVNGKAPEAEIQAAIDFLDSIATTEEGAKYMVEEAGMVPAFNSVTLQPEGQFSRELIRYNSMEGGAHNWYFPLQPSDYGSRVIGPIMDLYSQDPSDPAMLAQLLTQAVAEMPTSYAE
ncbi:MAG: carbohydrate ABC transporter substrate-binding protein [Christensenellaceae bacterium]|nr:carbohydrate ABC transporter substrate-binding protein [Christensenellaceae bacterium]